MKGIIELPMNMDPYIHSNVSRASLFSVLTSEEYSGKLNAVFSKLLLIADERTYDGFSEKDFINCMENAQMDVELSRKTIKFYSHPYTESKFAYLYQNIDGKKPFSIETTIDYVQDSNANSYVKLILSQKRKAFNKDTRECGFINEWSLKLFSNGKLFLHSDAMAKDMLLEDNVGKQSITLKFEKESLFTIKYSFDGLNWIEVYKSKLELDGIMEAGVYVSPKINPFFYDFYTSHIQLCYTSDNMIIAPHFDYYERYFSKMIPARQIPMSMIDISDRKVIDYFVDLLSRNYYINLGVDEYYIPGRNDYGKRHHMHVNFIYGVDKSRKVFKLMGFDTFLKFSEINFEDFFYGIQRDVGKGAKINLYRYNSIDYPDSFNINAVVYLLKAYLTGHHSFAISSSEIIIEDCNKPIVYGLDIYELICNDAKHMSRFLRDIRIIYQIYEHHLILKEMLGFINHIQILSDDDYKSHSQMFDEIIQLSAVIKNVVLKNRMATKEGIENKIKGMLLELKEKETYAISELIECLKLSLSK